MENFVPIEHTGEHFGKDQEAWQDWWWGK